MSGVGVGQGGVPVQQVPAKPKPSAGATGVGPAPAPQEIPEEVRLFNQAREKDVDRVTQKSHTILVTSENRERVLGYLKAAGNVSGLSETLPVGSIVTTQGGLVVSQLQDGIVPKTGAEADELLALTQKPDHVKASA